MDRGGTVEKLTEEQVREALETLSGWTLKDGKLHREYRFADFVYAFGFMATAALEVEKKNHHPEWSNAWNRVTIGLTTHDAGGITGRDIELARTLEKIATLFLP